MKRTILFAIVLLLVLSPITGLVTESAQQPASSPAGDKVTGDVFIHIGSPLILSGDTISQLDPNNPDVAAVLLNNRTLVPLHALSEYFKADVTYDAAGKKAIIEFNGKKFIFSADQKKYIRSDGSLQKEISMDTETKIINDRIMVPLKVICEDILGRKVSYCDKVIAISDKKINLAENETLLRDIKSRIGSALKVQSINELKAAVVKQSALFRGEIEYVTAAVSENSVQNTTESQKTLDDAGFSATNTQVQGIDEADIVKTDGKYIFITGNRAVRIVKASDGILSEEAVIKLSEDKNAAEIYIDKNRLILIGTRYERSNTKSDEKSAVRDSSQEASKMIMPHYVKNYSFIDIYDISAPKAPVLVKSHEMEGNYQSSRKNDSMVYLITDNHIYGDTFIPMMKDSVSGNKPVPLELNDIMIMPGYPVSGYVIVSAVDISNDGRTQVEAIATSGQLTYMNNTSLYLAADNYNGMSSIARFKIEGASVGYAGSAQVKGRILNQFSMDEHNGYFRVATTSDNENNLFILDGSLNTCGSVTGLAKGERIYSVRFMGDKGYIVTFRTMDPLFVFDLSDPLNPKVTGELKIPGFSSYLHPVGENLILGIGQDTYEIYKKDSSGKDVAIGTRQGGIKLSLFDVSDMGRPKEISNYVLGNSGSYTDVLSNHKAAMFDYSNNNVAFDASFTTGQDTVNSYRQGAVVFSYGNKSLELKGVLDYIQPEVSGIYIPYGRRTVYIGDKLYYIQDGIIASYDYKTLKPVDRLMLK